MRDMYAEIYEDLLAIPSMKGVKSVNETFAGAEDTHSIEILIDANGKGVQGATAHYLGQNFSDIFDIKFEDKNSSKNAVYQTCWGFTTRSIGIMAMVHGDDKGLVLPPKVAEHQVVIVPIYRKGADNEAINQKIEEITTVFNRRNVRYHVDDRTNYSPGWKFNHWEQKGVPIRLEIGPNDLKNNEVTIAVRHSGEKMQLEIDRLRVTIPRQLRMIHTAMLRKTRRLLRQRTRKIKSWNGFMNNIKKKNLVISPWCENPECEHDIRESSEKNLSDYNARLRKAEEKKALEEGKENTDEVKIDEVTGGVKSLCIVDRNVPEGEKCFKCKKKAKSYTLFGRSY